MRSRLALMVLVAGLISSSSEAGWFGNSTKLPKPIDSPVVRPKLKETHKMGAHSLAPSKSKYGSPTWGANWNRIFHERNRPQPPSYLRN